MQVLYQPNADDDAGKSISWFSLFKKYCFLTKFDFSDQQNNDPLTQNNNHFVSINILVSTYQEGYLFYASTTDFQVINFTFKSNPFVKYSVSTHCIFFVQQDLRCVAVFNFTSQVISLMFEVCFLHVLTQTGLETYNLPSLHATVLHENTVKTIF